MVQKTRKPMSAAPAKSGSGLSKPAGQRQPSAPAKGPTGRSNPAKPVSGRGSARGR
jgi:hypothetical protein